VLVPGMVISMEPMLTIPEGQPGAGGYREHDILVITQDGAENITGFPYGPEHQRRGLDPSESAGDAGKFCDPGQPRQVPGKHDIA
jgi:hypothetical protein